MIKIEKKDGVLHLILLSVYLDITHQSIPFGWIYQKHIESANFTKIWSKYINTNGYCM